MPVRFVAWMFPLGLLLLGVGVVRAQNYPVKPVHVLTSSPGSGVDFAARLIARDLSGALGQQVIVDNAKRKYPCGGCCPKRHLAANTFDFDHQNL